MDEIASASDEQAKGITALNDVMGDMEKVIQQMAVNTEESASAAEEMDIQARQMEIYAQSLFSLVRGTDKKALRKNREKMESPSKDMDAQSPFSSDNQRVQASFGMDDASSRNKVPE